MFLYSNRFCTFSVCFFFAVCVWTVWFSLLRRAIYSSAFVMLWRVVHVSVCCNSDWCCVLLTLLCDWSTLEISPSLWKRERAQKALFVFRLQTSNQGRWLDALFLSLTLSLSLLLSCPLSVLLLFTVCLITGSQTHVFICVWMMKTS